MVKYNFYQLLILLFTFGMLNTGCGKVDSKTHRAVIVIDVTGSVNQGIPDKDKVLRDLQKAFGEGNVSEWDGFQIGLTYLDDLSGSSIQWFSKQKYEGSTAMGNPKKQGRKYREFFQHLEASIDSMLKQVQPDRPQSKIYAKLCRTANKLLRKPADKYYLILYTDLLENSELANFYSADTLTMAASKPMEFYKKHLAPTCKMPDLSPVLIHLYPYRLPQTDVLINHAEKFWVSLFDGLGAEVEVNP